MRVINERAVQTILGVAYGDALGMPTEGKSREEIFDLYPDGIKDFYGRKKDAIFSDDTPRGSITDDTANTLAIIDAIVDNKGDIDAIKYMRFFKKWLVDNPKYQKFAGTSTRLAIEKMQNGVPLEKTGITGCTNGAIMKISPVGILRDYHDLNGLVDTVEQICIPTHNTTIAISGASAVAACISYGVRGGYNLDEMWDIAVEASKIGAKRGNKWGSGSVERRIKEMVKLARNFNKQYVTDALIELYGVGNQICETIGVVVVAVELSDRDPLACARYCAEIGGDSDTFASIGTGIVCSLGGVIPKEKELDLINCNGTDFRSAVNRLLNCLEDK